MKAAKKEKLKHAEIFTVKVLHLMEQKKMSLQSLARHTGLSRSGLYKITEEVSNPTVRSMEKIAEALGVELTTLLTNED